MHTGYDNFWMYQNSRHEPVLNIPKNDNYNQAILTDCYKQVQNGGRPSHLNSYIPPQNNDASSHQNKQHTALDSNCMWSSSVYSMPLNFSNSRNVHPQEAFLAQSSNVNCASSNFQPQQYCGYKYLKNSNVNVSQMYKNINDTNNYNNCENSVLAMNNGNSKAQTQRIRVKDVFTLNNSTLCYQFLSNSSQQPHPKEQQECALNCPTVNYTRASISDTQSELINYGKNNMPQPPTTYYGHTRATEELPQYLQNSGSFYHQNAEFSLSQNQNQSQNQFRSGRPIQQNLQLDTSKTNTCIPLIKQLLYSRNSQDPKGQIERSQSDSMYGNTSKIQQRQSVPISNLEINSNSGCANSLEVNTGVIQKTSNLNFTHIQHQENLKRMNVVCLPPNSSAAALTSNSVKNITSNGKGGHYEQISGPEQTVKISYPHNFQSTVMTLNDFNNTDKNSNINLPILLESNEKFCRTSKKNNPINNNNTRENGILNLPQTSQNNQAPSCVSSTSILAQNCQEPPRRRLHLREPFINLNKENVANFLNSNETCENTLENMSAMNDKGAEIIPRKTVVQNYPSNILALKQENYNENVENPSTTNHIPEEKVSFESIKTEENCVDENPEDPTLQEYEAPLEKPDGLMESFVVEDSKDTYFTKVDVDEFVLPSEKSQITSSDVGDYQGVDNLNANQVTEKNIEGEEAETTDVVDPKKNYKSKINRDKLDMLIQFLEADGPIDTNLKPPCKKKIRSNNDRNKGVDLNHNRRKLNKTHIIKNKNNSREMISYKIARVELTKCSSEPSQILKVNSGKVEERNYSNAEDELKNVSLTEQAQEISSQPSPERNCKIQDEENFLRTIRALQNLKSHLCAGCGFISPTDSFWINVASGELRCFNCFSKAEMTGEQKVFKSKPDGSTNFESKSIPESQAEEDSESNRFECITQNNVKSADKSNNLPKVENANGKSTNTIKETIKHEVIPNEQQIEGENTRKKGIESSHTLRKQRVSSENKTSESGRSWEDQKKLTAKHPVKINKSKETSITTKEKHSEHTPAMEMKEKKWGDSSSQHRKRSDSKDNKFVDENSAKNEEKRVNDWSDTSVKVMSHFTHKDNSEQQIIKKNSAKCEQSEKSKTQSPFAERETFQKPKPSEQGKSNEFNSSDESKIKSLFSLNSAEKHKTPDTVQLRKRKNSEENCSNKIRILEDNTGKEKIPTKITNVLKEDSTESKNKISDNERRKNSAEKSKKNNLSNDDGDQPKKETKPVLDLSDNSKMKNFHKEDAAYQKMKAYEQAKQKTSETTRRNSKDEQALSSFDKHREGSTSKESFNCPKSSLQEIGKKGTKYGSIAVENNIRKKTGEKDKKHSLEKTQKSCSWKKDSGEKVAASIENARYPGKSDTTPKPPKEDQNNKHRSETPKVKLKNKDSHSEKKEGKRHAEGRKDEKVIDKHLKVKEMTNSEKKKDWERLERMWKCDQSQTELLNWDACDKAVGLGRKNETDSNCFKRSLLKELLKKTQKLSWNLLSDV